MASYKRSSLDGKGARVGGWAGDCPHAQNVVLDEVYSVMLSQTDVLLAHLSFLIFSGTICHTPFRLVSILFVL